MGVMICAHRGLESAGPENSLEGIMAAVEAGFKAVEIDVRHTADGVLVLMHDATVERTSTGRGALHELAYAELTRLRLTWQGRLHTIVDTRQELDGLLRRVLPIMVQSSRLPEPQYVAYVHGRGLLLELDTMGEPDRQAREEQRYELWERYLSCGADFVMSDHPEQLRAFLKETLGLETRDSLP